MFKWSYYEVGLIDFEFFCVKYYLLKFENTFSRIVVIYEWVNK